MEIQNCPGGESIIWRCNFVLIYVVGSVRRNRLLKKVTRAEVEMVVKLWLRYAIDRSGGRNVRTGSVRRAAKRSSCGDQVDSDSD